jgi:alpha-galactosidase/6-phospho-beta-glucosidase family protein
MVKIIRLKSGEDIIGMCNFFSNSEMDIFEPMTVDVETRGTYAGQLIMANWLPVNLIKDNKTTLKTEDILLTMDPEDSFIEYYTTMVDKLKEALQAKRDVQDMSDEQISEILNAMENPESRVLH